VQGSEWLLTKKAQCVLTSLALVLSATAAHAQTASYTGTLSSPEDSVEFVFTLTTPGAVGLQTYGFGGGTNAAGSVISPGGTDPFLAIFSGIGSGATIVTDGSGNPYGTSLDLSNYGNPNFIGCPPANTVNIGGTAVCGDITMTIPSLAAGTYTAVLSDGDYVANAVYDNGTLGEGFTDFTGGGFCNIIVDNNGDTCPNNSGAYALDVTTPGTISSTPEPGTPGLVGLGLTGLGLLYARRRSLYKRRRSRQPSDSE
jgi:uncharacterized protein (TIGR03382 family)